MVVPSLIDQTKVIVPEFPEPLEEETTTVSFVLFLELSVTVGAAGALTPPDPPDPPPPVVAGVNSEFPKSAALLVIFPY